MIDYKDAKAVLEICGKATPGPWKAERLRDIDRQIDNLLAGLEG